MDKGSDCSALWMNYKEFFEEWEEDMPDSDEEEEDEGDEDAVSGDRTAVSAARGDEDEGDGIMTSHLRHFVAQPYIHPPLRLAVNKPQSIDPTDDDYIG